MTNTWLSKTILAFCLLLPLTFAMNTFDQFGTPKMVVFLFLVALLGLLVINATAQLVKLPRLILVAGLFFLAVQCFQVFRLRDWSAGIFGAYGQSESLLVQLGFIIVFLGGFLFATEPLGLNRLRTTLCLTTILIGTYGIFQYFFADSLTKATLIRVEALFGDPNSFGIFLVLVLPLIFTAYLMEKDLLPRAIIICGFCLGIVALVLTFSRTAWIGAVISFSCFSLGIWRIKKAKYLKVLLALVIFSILASQALISIQSKSHSDYQLTSRISSIAERKDSGRFLIWSTAWRVFCSSPWTGYGLGSFEDSFHRYQPKETTFFWDPERDLRQVHNEFLHYLATQGLLGLGAYLGLLIILLVSAKPPHLWRNQSPPQIESLALWSAIIGYLVCMQFAYPLIHYSFLFWLYLGILVYRKAPFTVPTNSGLKIMVLFPGLILLGVWTVLLGGLFQADLLYNRAFNQSKHKAFQSALANYNQAIMLAPSVYQYRYRYALTLIRAAYWKEGLESELSREYFYQAQEVLTQLAKTHPQRYQNYLLLGEIAEAQTDFKAAANFYTHAITLYPNNYKLYFHLGQVAQLVGDHATARFAFKSGIRINQLQMRQLLRKEGLLHFPLE